MLQLITLGIVIVLVLIYNLIEGHRNNTFKIEFRIIEIPDEDNINECSYYIQQKNLANNWKTLTDEEIIGDFCSFGDITTYKNFKLQNKFPVRGKFKNKEDAHKFILELIYISKKANNIKQEIIKTYEEL
jgi:hypothetical protein